MNRQQALEAVKVFGSPEDVACCGLLLDYIEAKSKKIYYYSDFVEAVSALHLRDAIQNVQRCLNVLKSKRLSVIKQEYRYLDDDGVIYEVGVEDLQAAYEDGALNLEWRNQPDSDFASKIYIVFVAGAGAV